MEEASPPLRKPGSSPSTNSGNSEEKDQHETGGSSPSKCEGATSTNSRSNPHLQPICTDHSRGQQANYNQDPSNQDPEAAASSNRPGIEGGPLGSPASKTSEAVEAMQIRQAQTPKHCNKSSAGGFDSNSGPLEANEYSTPKRDSGGVSSSGKKRGPGSGNRGGHYGQPPHPKGGSYPGGGHSGMMSYPPDHQHPQSQQLGYTKSSSFDNSSGRYYENGAPPPPGGGSYHTGPPPPNQHGQNHGSFTPPRSNSHQHQRSSSYGGQYPPQMNSSGGSNTTSSSRYSGSNKPSSAPPQQPPYDRSGRPSSSSSYEHHHHSRNPPPHIVNEQRHGPPPHYEGSGGPHYNASSSGGGGYGPYPNEGPGPIQRSYSSGGPPPASSSGSWGGHPPHGPPPQQGRRSRGPPPHHNPYPMERNGSYGGEHHEHHGGGPQVVSHSGAPAPHPGYSKQGPPPQSQRYDPHGQYSSNRHRASRQYSGGSGRGGHERHRGGTPPPDSHMGEPPMNDKANVPHTNASDATSSGGSGNHPQGESGGGFTRTVSSSFEHQQHGGRGSKDGSSSGNTMVPTSPKQHTNSRASKGSSAGTPTRSGTSRMNNSGEDTDRAGAQEDEYQGRQVGSTNPPPLQQAPSDQSWHQLQNVASVEDQSFLEQTHQAPAQSSRNHNKKNAGGAYDGNDSTASSLSTSSSPVNAEGGNSGGVPGNNVGGAASSAKKEIANTSSLDSLSDVASIQEPIATEKEEEKIQAKAKRKESDGDMNQMPSNEPNPSGSGNGTNSSSKRSRASSVDCSKPPGTGGAPNQQQTPTSASRPSKRQHKDSKYKQSPLAISCSPPGSPGGNMGMLQMPHGEGGASSSRHHHGHGHPHPKQTGPGNYQQQQQQQQQHYQGQPPPQAPGGSSNNPPPGDGAGTFNQSYSGDDSMNSGSYPPLPRYNSSGPPQPPPPAASHQHRRPSDSSETTIPRMQSMASMPSWDIQGQDSFTGGPHFGSGSGGSQLLNPSFSFNSSYNLPPDIPPAPSGGGPPMQESRNQSFEHGPHGHHPGHSGNGGNNGPIGRSASVDSGSGRVVPNAPSMMEHHPNDPYGYNSSRHHQHHQGGSSMHSNMPPGGQHAPPHGHHSHHGHHRPESPWGIPPSSSSGGPSHPPPPPHGHHGGPHGHQYHNNPHPPQHQHQHPYNQQYSQSHETHSSYHSHGGRQHPPQSSSWTSGGTGGSGSYHNHMPQHGHHGHGHGPPPPHGRGPSPPNLFSRYDDTSQRRTSPPGMMDPHEPIHPGFQAPRHDFVHHPSRQNKPPPTVYIVSSNPHGARTRTATGGYDPSLMNVNGPNAAIVGGTFGWSAEDDARLTEVMKKYKNPTDWEPVAKEHGRGKTAKQCHERWIRYLKPGVRKGQWQDHEDAIVVEAVTTSEEQPFTRWSDLAQRLPGRVGKQIRDRWVNHLNPNINHMPFTREDDLLLFKGHQELGKRWVEISTKFFNSTRSENHIKNRWYSASFKKFIANEFGPDAYSKSGGGGGDKGGSTTSPRNKSAKANKASTDQTQGESESNAADVKAV